MAKTVTITNGSGTSRLINGEYEVSANAVAYDNTTLNPTEINVVEGTNTYAFTISATGTLTLHVTEDGTAAGIPIVGATFIRTDSSGNEYGSAITTDSNGDAEFNNVPFAQNNAPTIYFKQTASDGDHEFDDEVQSTIMTTSTQTLQIENEPGEERTLTLMDSNYANLPIGSATLTLSNE